VANKRQDNAGGNGVAPAQAILDAEGIDSICARICDGEPMTHICASLNVSFGTLQTWLESVPERLARSREARSRTSRMWDEKALQGIENASDPFELAKAKEAAHHLRWRATKIAPADYGEKVQQEVTGKDGGPVQYATLTTEQLHAEARALLALIPGDPKA
jgi:hypothetical protein